MMNPFQKRIRPEDVRELGNYGCQIKDQAVLATERVRFAGDPVAAVAAPTRREAEEALNLMASHHPHWTTDLHDDGTLTVHPSVDATSCGSHFWIRRSQIDWV